MRNGLIIAGIALVTFVGANTVIRGNKTPAVQVRNCDKIGNPIINITQKIVNTVDSGQAGNYWAFDDLNRDIKVYDNGDGSYCAEVKYQGKFDSQAGQKSPGNTGVLTGNEDGTFQGGYDAVITGTMLATPAWKTNGSVGTTDYKCDLSGTCPGAVNWIGQYFGEGFTYNYSWWGWTYKYKNNTWINSMDGNSGDII